MNIFATSHCPIESAKALDDKRVIKMILESAQLLSTALYKLGYWQSNLYKPTHAGHPCTLWAMKSKGNFLWLVRHALALAEEYKYRYGRDHKSSFVIEACRNRINDVPLDRLGGPFYDKVTPFANCTPITGNISTVSKYRQYMIQNKWIKDSNWSRRGPPSWYKKNMKKVA